MPELPEVETIRKSLQALVTGKTIDRVSVHLPRIIRTPKDVEQFRVELQGLGIREIGRRGKYLLIHLDNAMTLVSHLRMEGRYGVYRAEDAVEPHTHVIFHFTDGTELRYRDVRQFGTMDLVPTGDYRAVPGLHKIGLEPLAESVTAEAFRNALKQKDTNIKAALLDQSCIAGLGNIYVDESLFRAGIHPETRVKTLKKEQFQRLFESVRDVLQRAVDAGGTSIKSYVNGYGSVGQYQDHLQVYGKEGTPCPKCGREIMKLRVAGRGTHLCPVCQPKPRTRKGR
jgi:formamidopyrimidine-DNA glycosylase